MLKVAMLVDMIWQVGLRKLGPPWDEMCLSQDGEGRAAAVLFSAWIIGPPEGLQRARGS